MNRAQAKRLALWTSGTYLFLTDTTGIDDDVLYAMAPSDIERVSRAVNELGQAMMARSGIPRGLTSAEAIAFVTAPVDQSPSGSRPERA